MAFDDQQPAKRAAEGHTLTSVARFTGLKGFCIGPQGFASLHPGLYAAAC